MNTSEESRKMKEGGGRREEERESGSSSVFPKANGGSGTGVTRAPSLKVGVTGVAPSFGPWVLETRCVLVP